MANFLNVLGALSPVLGSAVSAITSLFGGSQQAEAQEKANEQNYQMFHEQLGFTKDMYEDAKAYNTPANQMQRFRDAGLNPHLMFGSVDAGNAVAQTASAGNPIQPVTAKGQALQQAGAYVSQGLQQAVPAMQQVMSNKESIKAAQIENAFRASRLQNELVEQQTEIQRKLAEKNLTEQEHKNLLVSLDEINERVEQIRTYNQYLSRRLSAENEKLEYEADKTYFEAEYQRELARYQKLMSDALPRLQKAQTDALLAQAANSIASSRLFDAQADTEDLLRDEKLRKTINERLEVAARTLGIKLDNQQKESIMPYVIQQAQNEADAVKVGPFEVKGNSFRRFLNRANHGTPASKSNYRLDTKMGKPL